MTRYFLLGGAGFIGSNLAESLVRSAEVELVTIFDDFSSGRRSFLEPVVSDDRVRVIEGFAGDTASLSRAMSGHDIVVHLASNPDIAAAVKDPTIDFRTGSQISSSCFEAARLASVGCIVYISGSGVYGDRGLHVLREADVGVAPVISTYGASKLAGETLLAAYSHMFDIRAVALRLANVVGPKQTHGLGYNLVGRFINGEPLEVWGDGLQSKPYIHVDDVVSAIRTVAPKAGQFDTFNVSTDETLTVQEVLDLFLGLVRRSRGEITVVVGDEPRAWRGEVPHVRMSSDKLRTRGWTTTMSAREAVTSSLCAMLEASRG